MAGKLGLRAGKFASDITDIMENILPPLSIKLFQVIDFAIAEQYETNVLAGFQPRVNRNRSRTDTEDRALEEQKQR